MNAGRLQIFCIFYIYFGLLSVTGIPYLDTEPSVSISYSPVTLLAPPKRYSPTVYAPNTITSVPVGGLACSGIPEGERTGTAIACYVGAYGISHGRGYGRQYVGKLGGLCFSLPSADEFTYVRYGDCSQDAQDRNYNQ